MKHLLFVKNLNGQEDAERIREAFMDSRVEYEIILDRQCVVVYGRNDIVRAAKTLLAEAGFIVQ